MKKILPALLLLSQLSFFSAQQLFAQNQLVKQWDYRYGGTLGEFLADFHQTSEGGYILGGFSQSGINGDKTQDVMGCSDYWIVKLNSLGIKQWDKDFGGIAMEWLTSVQQTKDGGYILGGTSESESDGNKTQDSWGSQDYWIIKVDSLGNIQWDKDFGGTNVDWLSSIQQTKDGGYILGGYSYSGISGNKTQATWGNEDYWIVKVDSLGNMQWDKDFGGTSYDDLYALQQTADGGYILGGHSYSGISGDKTQATWGGITDGDYWILKTDSLGNKLWDKDFGGTSYDGLFSLQQTADGGYILGGYSLSGISGDKTQATWGGTSDADYWIVKTDSLGNKLWDKDFGGTNYEELKGGNISQTPDKGYLMAGVSASPISGDKSENNLGYDQTWIIKTDSLGNKQWDKTIFTDALDGMGLTIQTEDGCYAIANYTYAEIGGYKTQVCQGNVDYWIVKFCDTTGNYLLPHSYFSSIDTMICEKFCINFTDQSNNNPTSWQWLFFGGDPSFSTDQNPTNICYNLPGTYDVTLITTTANGTDTLTLPNYITVYPTPPFPTITQVGYTLTSSTATSYQWQFNSYDIPGATNQSYTISQTGYYTVIVGDSNGCVNSSTTYALISGIGEVDAGISVYPNPSSGSFIVELNGLTAGEVSIDVVNTLCQNVYSSTEKNSSSNLKKKIDLVNVPPGLYFIEIKTTNEFIRKKLVIAY